MDTVTEANTSQYLTFTLADEEYALEVSKVREVLEMTKITRVPRMPDFMKGIINLRGGVVPVIDLKKKFGLPETEHTVDTSIVVMEITYEDEILSIGAIADSVQQVIEIGPDDIEPPPKIGTNLETEFISGMGKKNGDFIIILNIERVFEESEISTLVSGQQTAREEPRRPDEETE